MTSSTPAGAGAPTGPNLDDLTLQVVEGRLARIEGDATIVTVVEERFAGE